MRFFGKRPFAAGELACLLSYLALVYCWFDHDLGSPPKGALALAAVVFALSVGWLLWKRGLPRAFADRRDNRLLASVFGLALASRVPFLAGAYGLFSSDAAVQGIMALHILQGKHHPIFLYRWSYCGTWKAHLTALIAWLSGEPVLSFAVAGFLMTAVFAAAVYALARVVLPRRPAVVAALYVVWAPGYLTAWGLHNEGNYVDVLAFGTVMLVLGARLVRDHERALTRTFWIGVLGGLGFWAHILATYYLLTALVVVVACDWSRRVLLRLPLWLGGFLVGYFPGLLWNVSHGWLSFRWWGLDQTPAVDRAGRAATQLVEVFRTSLTVLAGWWPPEHPPWPGPFWRWALLLLLPAAFLAFAARFRGSLRPVLRARLTPEAVVVLFPAIVLAVFAQSSFGWMTEDPRYLIFLFSVVPLFIASALGSLWGTRWRGAAVAAALLLAYVNLYGTATYFSRAVESDGANRSFLEQLDRLGIRYGHTDYYVSYKYNFLSHGRLVLTSALGPSQTEWYLPYRQEVDRAERIALIPRSYRFARRICRRLDAQGVTYRRVDILYPVIFDLSKKVKLEQLR